MFENCFAPYGADGLGKINYFRGFMAGKTGWIVLRLKSGAIEGKRNIGT